MAKKKIQELIEERYEHEEVRAAILKSVEENKTADKIESGVLTLPSEHDALRFTVGIDRLDHIRNIAVANPGAGVMHDQDAHDAARLRLKELREGK